ncbi:hypothetical protein GCM10010201_01100 [Pilimelia columellifera subsp. columellifera]|uniref:Type II secretion system protein GspF domain-containing protein n=2 Tax=Pilimelia TaxID=53370 RepID=A0ABN3MWE3_9ACTN
MLVASGPVAAVITVSYCSLAAAALRRQRRERHTRERRRRELDEVGALAADLRAGVPPAAVMSAAPRAASDLPGRVGAALSLAETTGAPLADLVERIAADARAASRARTAVEAQTASAQATAWLLAGLPLGGVAIGYGIGAHPLTLLLHTPLGAGCALAAVGLQAVGIAWSQRITDADRAAG